MKCNLIALATIFMSLTNLQAAEKYPLMATEAVKAEVLKQVLLVDFVGYLQSQKRSSYFDSAENNYLSSMSYFHYSSTPADVDGAIYPDSKPAIAVKNAQGQALPILEGKSYETISTTEVDLGESLSTKPFLGWDDPSIKTASQFLEYWLQRFAVLATEGVIYKNIDKAYLTDDGVHIAEMVEKISFGAMSLSQGADYLLNAKSTEDWDKAYIALGAASDLLNYSDVDTKGKVSVDTNKDGFISLITERNYAMAVYAANADFSAKDGQVDFTTELGTAFIKGRAAFETDPTLAKQYALTIIKTWEKAFAAKAVGYLNRVILNVDLAGTSGFDYSKIAGVWSEAKGFALAIQYSPVPTITAQALAEVHQLLKSRPVLPTAGLDAMKNYKQDLLKARKIFQDTYQFSETNVNNW